MNFIYYVTVFLKRERAGAKTPEAYFTYAPIVPLIIISLARELYPYVFFMVAPSRLSIFSDFFSIFLRCGVHFRLWDIYTPRYFIMCTSWTSSLSTTIFSGMLLEISLFFVSSITSVFCVFRFRVDFSIWSFSPRIIWVHFCWTSCTLSPETSRRVSSA